MSEADSVKEQVDERRIARGVALGLPLVTLVLASVTGVVVGVPIAILVLAAGLLLGVIALFWASLRVLSGDAALPPELEALDLAAHGVDALASRKKMLLRALKDLDNERALGKLADEDYEQVSSTYRSELKDVLKRIDASLEPYRGKAEELAREHLVKAGVVEKGYRGDQPKKAEEPVEKKADAKPARVTCAKCEASNEPDAKFCKGCGASLADAKAADEEEEADDEA